MKIINILPHIPADVIYKYTSPEEFIKRFPYTKFIEIETFPYWVGFFQKDWHCLWGKYIKNLASDLEIECWRPYGDKIDKVYEKKIDGILNRVFPSSSFNIKKIGSINKSPLMLEYLKNEMKSERVVVHFYGSHNPLITWILLKLKPQRNKIILQHLGWGFSWFEFIYRKNPLKLIPYFFEKKVLKYVGLYLTASKVEEKFLKKKFPKLRCEFFYNGIDIEKTPLIPKCEARKRLNIPLHKKVVLYVGRYYSTKNVGQIIKTFIELKLKDNDIELFLVGGYENDELYQQAVDSGANVILRQDKPITDYFAAADVYLMPINDPMHRDFAGFGIAPMEALAQNTPVISPNLIHFENHNDIVDLGIRSESISTLADDINLIFNKEYNTRHYIKKYLNLKKNSKKLIDFYRHIDEILNK